MTNQTMKNLLEAFAGEAQANRRYRAFAVKAEEEGLGNLARLFRAIAESEAVHAANHLRAMGGVKSSVENVEEARNGEVEEYKGMYPMFIDQARRDINNEALTSFIWANSAEQTHGDLYEKALAAVKGGGDVELEDIYICEVCGHTVEGEAPDTCPICNVPKEKFRKVS